MFEGSIDAIDLDIAALVNESLSPAARSAALANFARETLADVTALNTAALGYAPDHATFVDGIAGADESNVKPDGEIGYSFRLLDDIFSWIKEQIDTHSPVGSGADPHPGLYKSAHVFFADGQEIGPNDAVPAASKYIFFNTEPYSRPIERGESSQAPNGVYEAVATLAQQRFGNQASISFAFINPADGGIVDWAQTPLAQTLAKRIRGGRRELHFVWLTRVPAIIVIPR
jgi:hypothetical protein